MSANTSLKTQSTYIDSEKVRSLFEKYDLNKNGIMEKNEFIKVMGSVLKELGEDVDESRFKDVVEEGLNRFDLNENGKLEFNEFFEFIHFLISEKGYNL